MQLASLVYLSLATSHDVGIRCGTMTSGRKGKTRGRVD